MDETFYWGRSGKQATVIEVTCKLAQKVDVKVLSDSLLSALKVHTNFRIQPVVVKRRFHAVIEDVTTPPVMPHDGRPRHLGTKETQGLMLYVTYKENEITLHVFHGISDLRGVYAFLNTLLKFYYNELGVEGIELPKPDSMDSTVSYEDILKEGTHGKAKGRFNPKEHNIFHLPENKFGKNTTRQRIFEINLPLQPLLDFAKENKSSVVPTLHAIIGQAIRKTYEAGEKNIVGYIPIDLRPVFNFETGGNGVSTFSLPYPAKLDRYGLSERSRHLRDEMEMQIQPDNLYAGVAALRQSMEPVFRLRLPKGILSGLAVRIGRKRDASSYTYGISYAGKITFGEQIDPYVTAVTACAGSYSYPLWNIACEYKGTIRMMFVQAYESDTLIRNIYHELSGLFGGTAITDKGYHEFDEFHL